MMPGLDGYEVCRRLKSDQDTRLLPVVFLTGLDSREARLQGLEAGATDFLSKPFELVELEVRVRNLVHFRRLTQDLDDASRCCSPSPGGRGARRGDRRPLRPPVRGGVAPGGAARPRRRLAQGAAPGRYLHDIGKIAIPDAILLKPGRLTQDEWKVMRSHVNIGVDICTPLRSLKPVLPIIRHHHERADGSGYPDKLRGESIPLLARVFQVVDVFDALTSNRPYRKALTPTAAFATLREEVHKGWWDERIVVTFAAMIEEESPLDSHTPTPLDAQVLAGGRL